MPPHASNSGMDVLSAPFDEIELGLNGRVLSLGSRGSQFAAPTPMSAHSINKASSLLDMDDEDDDIIEQSRRDGELEAEAQDQACGMIYDSFTSLCAPVCEQNPGVKSALKKQAAPGVEIRPSRSVSFNSLTIREHDLTLGDHPSSASGPPVQLDWKPKTVSTMSLEDYENARQPRRKRRQLKLSFQEREDILQTNGFTMDELKDAWMESLKIRQQRYETLIQGSLTTKVEEAWESACRKFNRMWTLSEAQEGYEVKSETGFPNKFQYVNDENTPPPEEDKNTSSGSWSVIGQENRAEI